MEIWLGQQTALLREAAKSPLGAIALMIFASSSIMLYLFAQSNEFVKLGAFLLLLLAFGMFTLAIVKKIPHPSGVLSPQGDSTPNADASKTELLRGQMAAKPASLFWLAYDLRYVIDATLHNFSKDNIAHHLKQVVHHAKALELNQVGHGGHGRWWEVREMSLVKPCPEDLEPVTSKIELESIEERVWRIRSEVEGSNEKTVSLKQRQSWAVQLEEIAVLVGKLAVAGQPGFVPEPP
jgi:hypothetical protein